MKRMTQTKRESVPGKGEATRGAARPPRTLTHHADLHGLHLLLGAALGEVEGRCGARTVARKSEKIQEFMREEPKEKNSPTHVGKNGVQL